MPAEDRKFVTALARGLDVLAVFRAADQGLTNQEIAARTGLPRPTVTRLTYTLVELGYLVFSPRTGLYQLGAGVVRLGQHALATMDLRQRAAPLMQELADGPNRHVTVALAERVGTRAVYVEVQRPEEAVSLSMAVGDRLPLAASAIGRALLAALPDRQLAHVLSQIRDQASPSSGPVSGPYSGPGSGSGSGSGAGGTPEAALPRPVEDTNPDTTPDTGDQLRRTVQEARSQIRSLGYCTSFGDWRPEINGIAAPLPSPDGARLFALNVGGPAFLVPAEDLTRHYGPRLAEIARSLRD
ncbi:IclR family transcriptional regulator [Pannonibacter tanglangensis]|uniref:Helix-turn-helix domain-containing protein n=1 Tax=Pannonibacter tanglangensis TaxID=2750084 RepID=A0ABW9ZGG8_9HYPH|nr:IclR family transcriptional regulator [Pannonibacter sp. XCT-34]NBN63067.1 helix-turn-helix domain-containing protein [Pannonibacter sp. XCT-34]